jgi:Na+/H+-translocating membrane pyrophosphatase
VIGTYFVRLGAEQRDHGALYKGLIVDGGLSVDHHRHRHLEADRLQRSRSV